MRVPVPEWTAGAECAAVAGFHDLPDARKQARCARCPVWRDCLEYGLDEKTMTYGGLGRRARLRLQRLLQNGDVDLTDPAIQSGVRYLVANGLAVDRLALLLDHPVDDVRATTANAPPTQPRRKAQAVAR